MTRAAARAAREATAQTEDSDATKVSEQPPAADRAPAKRKTVTFKEPCKGRGRGKAAKGADCDDTVGVTMKVSCSFDSAAPPPRSCCWASG